MKTIFSIIALPISHSHNLKRFCHTQILHIFALCLNFPQATDTLNLKQYADSPILKNNPYINLIRELCITNYLVH